jgi:Fur family ferric uptake transcriptional regulator
VCNRSPVFDHDTIQIRVPSVIHRRRAYHRHVSDVEAVVAVGEPSLADVLRARGLRLTAQRQLVLEAVRRLGHATPEQVRQAVCRTAAGVNITTIYRTLELLEGLGLVNHTHLSHGAPTYHVPGERSHVHLVCHRCGAVAEAPLELLRPLADDLAAKRGFRLDIGHMALFGTCAECDADES